MFGSDKYTELHVTHWINQSPISIALAGTFFV